MLTGNHSVFFAGGNMFAGPIERERRWLVLDYDHSVLQGLPLKRIRQGYLEVQNGLDLRVRVVTPIEHTPRVRACITLKIGKGLMRQEFEHEIDVEPALTLYGGTPYRVDKVRLEKDGFELDVFQSILSDIVLLEYEAKGDEPIPDLPPWVFRAIDVTDAISNVHLARVAKEIVSKVPTPMIPYLEAKLPKVVLTGGCGTQKQSLLLELKEKFGNEIECVPDVAFLLLDQIGLRPNEEDQAQNARFQNILYRVRRSFEEAAELRAIECGKKVIFLEHGTIDAIALMPQKENTDRQLQFSLATGVCLVGELSRYIRVVHLGLPIREMRDSVENPDQLREYQKAYQKADREAEAWHKFGQEAWVHFRFQSLNGKPWEAVREEVLKLAQLFCS